MTSREFLVEWLRRSAHNERGAALVEYALLLALIAVICITAVAFLGNQLSERFDSTGASFDSGN